MILPYVVPRPQPNRDGGLLAPEFCQTAYVTNDIEKATQVLQMRYDIEAFTRFDNEMPDGSGTVRIALAWVNDVMLEIIDTDSPNTIFTTKLPANEFAIRHHHFGYFIEDDAAWDRARDHAKREGLEVVMEGDVPDMLRFFYIWSPEFDHYLEYIQPRETGRQFFASVAGGHGV